MHKQLMMALLLVSFSASAATYKCQVDGKVVYSDKPCATGDTLKMKGGVPVQDKGIMTTTSGPASAPKPKPVSSPAKGADASKK